MVYAFLWYDRFCGVSWRCDHSQQYNGCKCELVLGTSPLTNEGEGDPVVYHLWEPRRCPLWVAVGLVFTSRDSSTLVCSYEFCVWHNADCFTNCDIQINHYVSGNGIVDPLPGFQVVQNAASEARRVWSWWGMRSSATQCPYPISGQGIYGLASQTMSSSSVPRVMLRTRWPWCTSSTRGVARILGSYPTRKSSGFRRCLKRSTLARGLLNILISYSRTRSGSEPSCRVPEIVFWHIPSKAYGKVVIGTQCVGSLFWESVAAQEAEMGMMKALEKRDSVKVGRRALVGSTSE